jgi:hypothetical protein
MKTNYFLLIVRYLTVFTRRSHVDWWVDFYNMVPGFLTTLLFCGFYGLALLAATILKHHGVVVGYRFITFAIILTYGYFLCTKVGKSLTIQAGCWIDNVRWRYGIDKHE